MPVVSQSSFGFLCDLGGRGFSQAHSVPPRVSSELTIFDDDSATSSSRKVRSRDWNRARRRMEYCPGGTDPPRKTSTGAKPPRSASPSDSTASRIFANVTLSRNKNEKSRSTPGKRGRGRQRTSRRE